MKNVQRKDRFTLVLSLLIVLTLNSCGKNDSPEMLAKVGDDVVTKTQMRDRLQDFKSRIGSGIADTGQLRRSLLSQMVDEKLLVHEAKKRGYHQDSAGKQERERIRIQTLLNAFYKEYVTENVQVTEADLKEYFMRFNTHLKARHLYAKTPDRADSLYNRLQAGESFEALARKTFKSKELQNAGGSIGFFKVDEMDPSFEEAAFSLRVGEISKPVRTAHGFSIIQLQDRVTNPLLTESQFAGKKGQLRKYIKKRKTEMLAKQLVDSLAQAFTIQYNNAALNTLYQTIRNTDDRSEERVLGVSDTDTLLTSKQGIWTVADFQNHARFTSESQQKWVSSPFAMREFINGLLVRDYMLETARNDGMHKADGFEEKVEYKFESYLISRMEKDIDAMVTVPEDSARAYYNDEPGRFARPPMIAVRTIQLNSQAIANQVEKQLASGMAFTTIRSRFHESQNDAEHEVYYTPQEFGGLATTLFDLKPGEYTGPHNVNEKYIFFQIYDIKAAQMRSFNAARAEVEKTLNYMYRDRVRADFLLDLRNKFPTQVYADRIRSLK